MAKAGCGRIITDVARGAYRRQSKAMGDAYSKGAVKRAGKVLRDQHTEVTPALLEAFRVAHVWRESHIDPMRSLRIWLGAKARSVNSSAVTAGRLKRTKSIRKKLNRTQLSLTDIQDLGGCRAIVGTIEECRALADRIVEASPDNLKSESDYIASPKESGYRSHHLVLRHRSDDPAQAGRLIEFQLRTELQHAWATTLEAVGLVRGEDLKAGFGSPEWLRFFAVMSAEIADRENSPHPIGTPFDPIARRAELIDLDRSLDAVSTLDSYRRIIEATRTVSAGPGGMFLIEYDPRAKSVRVDSMRRNAADAYNRRENRGSIDTVLVEVDRAADLRAAYPNYYLDVNAFLLVLRRAIGPRSRSPWRPDFSGWKLFGK